MNKIKGTLSFVMLLALLFVSVKSLALDYTISFSGTGASTTIGSVIVQNLTKGTSTIVPGGNVLNLTDQANGVEQLTSNNEDIRVYPTPEEGKYKLIFFSKNTGATQISAYSIDGRKMAGINTNLQSGDNSFQLLLPKGLYAIHITGNGYTYATKLVNQIGTGVQAAIQFTGSSNSEKPALQKSKGVAAVTMNYTTGDLLLYKGISGNYCTIITDVPASSKTTNFDFVECRDANGNYYSTVKVGSQTWMAENLKSTKYRNGDDITNLTNNADWGLYPISSWCNYNNDAANATNFGKLYNWYAISDSRNIAPIGWHVASDAEWTMLTSALGGETLSGGKLKETSLNHWLSPNSSATNETGFTAVPAGNRLTSGQFDNLGNKGNWWSLTENGSNYAWYRYVYTGSASVVRDYYNKNVGFSVRCVKDASLPTISTATPSSISYTTAVGGGNITSDGGAPVTVRGVCWSTTSNPTIADSKSSSETGTGTFTCPITGLNINTTYYVRAYATNSSGTAYGDQVTFKSLPYDALTATDADGNLYHSITIGTQVWMVENLKTTKYRNGDVIGTTSSLNMDLTYATAPKYQWAYNGVESNVNTYGRLYTWHAVADPRNLAPAGWHVASDAEWSLMENYLITNGYNYDKTTTGNKIAKSLCSTTLWNTSSTIGTAGYDMTQNNSTGFSMFPGGYRGFDGYFYILGTVSDVWTSTEYSTTNSLIRNLGYNVSSTNFLNSNKNYGFSVRCIKNTLPILSTNISSSVWSTKVNCGGNVTADGGETVTESGVCWSTLSSPTIADSKKSIGTGTGSFAGSITGLTPNTTYYLRAYATNSLGTAYGEQFSFKTLLTDPPTVTDIDGNVYQTVTIGTQTWLVENLRTTKYRNGDPIPNVTDNSSWVNLYSGAYCWYNNDIANKDTYGALYNGYTVHDSRNIAPVGWRVPTLEDWTTLSTYLGGDVLAGGKMKESGTTHWNSQNTGATNESGFTALPSGARNKDTGAFTNLGLNCFFWNKTSIDSYSSKQSVLYYDRSNFGPSACSNTYGNSVRCIKNSTPTVTTSTPTVVYSTSSTCGGNVTFAGGETVTESGVCWSTEQSPTIATFKKSIASGTGAFTGTITGLTPNTTYYVRAYATNSMGTAYGSEMSFKTLVTDPPTVTDADGNLYHSVIIGTQIWMVENLKTTKYRNGDIIGTTNSLNMDLTYASAPKYQWAYNGVESNANTYGRLYTWHAVADPRNLAPAGWHVASDAEWSVMENYLITNGYNYDKTTTGNKIAKSLCSTTLWNTSSTIGTAGYDMTQNNSTGFSMFPGGYRGLDGYYYIMGTVSDVWTSTEYSTTNSLIRSLGYNVNSLNSLNSNKNLGFSVRCIKNSLPVLSTNIPSFIWSTKVNCGGNVTADGGETVTESGVCWSTEQSPTIANFKKSIGNGTGSFTGSITGLTTNTTYYVRAYATNSLGTAYGEQMSFKTLLADPPTVTDIDGNVYQTVTIGTQTWMAENLKTTKYNDGTPIPLVTDKTTWMYMSSPAYCWFDNDSIKYKNNGYGAIYNWYTVNTGKLAPKGWHVPTENEWNILINYLGGNTIAGGKLKETGLSNWTSPNSGATNETNFNALPSAGRGNNDATFEGIGIISYWWTATQQTTVYSRFVSVAYNSAGVGQNGSQRINGLAVRCIKNTIPVLSTTTTASILSTTAMCGGNVTFEGGEIVTDYGVCWSTATSPTITDSKKSIGSGTGAFTGTITGLTPNTTYYVRAYATNSQGTAYGEQVSFKTQL